MNIHISNNNDYNLEKIKYYTEYLYIVFREYINFPNPMRSWHKFNAFGIYLFYGYFTSCFN